MSTQDDSNAKDIVGWLDRAASRAEIIGRIPATPKQTWYIATILAKRGDDACDIDCGPNAPNAMLTSKEASGWIDFLLTEVQA